MSVKVTLEFSSIDEAITAMAKLRGPETKDTATPAAGKSAGASDKKASTAQDAGSKPTAADKKGDAPQTPQAESKSQVGYGIVADKIATKAKTHRAEVVALLKKFGAASGKELKEADYAAFVTDIDAIGAAVIEGDLA